MDLHTIQNAYKRHSAYYDAVFGKILNPGRQAAVKLINEIASADAKILEVGVGTGLSLPLYRPDLKITGIDVSKEMLDIARQRIVQLPSPSNFDLLEMDAEDLSFSGDTFDIVVAMYTASAVPDINRFLDEMTRVCKTDGDIIVVNHFTSKNPLLRAIETTLSTLTNYLGFHPDFPIELVTHYPQIKLVSSSNTNLLGYWKLLHLRNTAA